MLARFGAGIEAEVPGPLMNIERNAGTARDGAHANIAVIDLPAVSKVFVAAAGEGGHAPMIPPNRAGGKPLGLAAGD
jgi:hypothetical protein